MFRYYFICLFVAMSNFYFKILRIRPLLPNFLIYKMRFNLDDTFMAWWYIFKKEMYHGYLRIYILFLCYTQCCVLWLSLKTCMIVASYSESLNTLLISEPNVLRSPYRNVMIYISHNFYSLYFKTMLLIGWPLTW